MRKEVLPGNVRSSILDIVKLQGVVTKTAEVHIIKERLLFHQGNKEDNDVRSLSLFLLIRFLSKY